VIANKKFSQSRGKFFAKFGERLYWTKCRAIRSFTSTFTPNIRCSMMRIEFYQGAEHSGSARTGREQSSQGNTEMTAEQDYEPDWEDLAYLACQRRVLEGYREEHGEITRRLRDYRKRTDRQLRELSKEIRAFARDCRTECQFDLVSESYTGDVPDDYVPPRPLTRKEKRRRKTECRRALRQLLLWRQLGIWTKRGCSPRQVTGSEDSGFVGVVAAA
jgi:hypothetical protein